MTTIIKSPGKLILSGEHAVVYGASALAVAVKCYLTLEFTPCDLSKQNKAAQKKLSVLSPLGETTKTQSELNSLCAELDQRHQFYLNGNMMASDLLDHPHDLIFYVLAHHHFKQAGKITIHSDIPLGAGMGSSAAAIASTLALCLYSKTNKSLIDLAECTRQIKWCERLQHGKGSLIDAAAVCYGGFIEVCQSNMNALPIRLSEKNLSHWFVWNTGTPSYSTKEVVSYVAKKQFSQNIWQQFDQVTQRFKQQLVHMDNTEQSHEILQQVIKANHQLLCQINVVPKSIQEKIEWINQYHGAAKICGAGSLPNDHVAGQVLVYLPCLGSLNSLKLKGIDVSPIAVDYNGFSVAVN